MNIVEHEEHAMQVNQGFVNVIRACPRSQSLTISDSMNIVIPANET